MARPLSKLEDLKHPRRIRKSVSTSTRLDCKPPTKAQRKRWQPILDAVIRIVISNPERSDNTAKKGKIEIFFAKGTIPKDFPLRQYLERSDKGDLITINAELVLLWLFERGYTDYTPAKLYAARRGHLMEFNNLYNSLGIDNLEEKT